MLLLPNFRESLFLPADRVLIAVSGGPDSLSLLHYLWHRRHSLGLESVEAAHLDHGLRGDESAAEAAWVAAWCAERGIPCHVGLVDLGTRKLHGSKQEKARAARYAFLEQLASEFSATKIATAHTQDDQAETVLMNILRGTGLDGLRGIPEKRGLFVRPMLFISRAEIEAYCTAQGLEPRQDPSNFSPENYTRNRVRLELLPQLEREYHPGVKQSLLRLAEIAERDSDYLQVQADSAFQESLRVRNAFQIVLNRPTLAALHPALLRHVLRTAISALRGTGEGITYALTEQICAAIADDRSKAFGLTLPRPSCSVLVTQDAVTLEITLASTAPEALWQLQTSFEPLPDGVMLNADAITLETLAVRFWRPGDKIDPLGMGGRHKKVADIFTDAKVPRLNRLQVPIVTDKLGIVWVVGHCVSERAKVKAETRRVVYLCLAPTTHPASV